MLQRFMLISVKTFQTKLIKTASFKKMYFVSYNVRIQEGAEIELPTRLTQTL